MHYTVQDIKDILNAGGELPFPDIPVRTYLYDSRRLRSVENTLFIAISGRQHNGHDYIAELFEKGIRNFLVERVPGHLNGKANFIEVKNTLEAFQALAKSARSQFNGNLIAITGSNGKTIVKEWLYQLLQEDHSIVRTPKSYNSQLGVPLSVLQMTGHEDYAIFEAGISQPGEMLRLQEILRPRWGILTNIGSAHQEYFDSTRQKINEKLLLFKDVEGLVYSADQQAVAEAIDRFDFSSKPDMWSWSLKGREARVVYDFDKTKEQLRFPWKGENRSLPFPFTDDASVENALNALTTFLALGGSLTGAGSKLSALEPVSMRLEQKSGRWNTVLINDAYSADLESL
ncbi:MAG: Mur ligase family protein, partial [Owenweeksia sp.]